MTHICVIGSEWDEETDLPGKTMSFLLTSVFQQHERKTKKDDEYWRI